MNRSTSSGLSLIELMVTLLVAVILLGSAQPLFAELIDTRRLSGATDLIRSQLQFARSEAIKQMRPMVATYLMSNSTDWRIGIREESVCDTSITDPDAPDACSIPGPDGRSLTILDGRDFRGISASANRPATEFNPIHGSAMGTNVTLTLTTPGGKEARVIIGNIGRIRTCSPAGNQRIVDFPPC